MKAGGIIFYTKKGQARRNAKPTCPWNSSNRIKEDRAVDLRGTGFSDQAFLFLGKKVI